jgi:hypothetical protein
MQVQQTNKTAKASTAKAQLEKRSCDQMLIQRKAKPE